MIINRGKHHIHSDQKNDHNRPRTNSRYHFQICFFTQKQQHQQSSCISGCNFQCICQNNLQKNKSNCSGKSYSQYKIQDTNSPTYCDQGNENRNNPLTALGRETSCRQRTFRIMDAANVESNAATIPLIICRRTL